MLVYLDASAAMRLIVEESESAALAADLERRRKGGDTLVASLLLHTELHCASKRRPSQVTRQAVAAVLAGVSLVDVESGDLLTAPLLEGALRSADAVHLATALRIDARAMAVYDSELAAAAAQAGLEVLRPL